MKRFPRIASGFFFLVSLALLTPARARAEEPDIEDLYKKVVRSTVFIITPASGGFSMGSGSLIDIEKRIVITNYHVIAGSKYCYCQFPIYLKDGSLMSDKKKYIERVKFNGAIKADVLYQDVSRDLAILRLEKVPAGLVPLPLSPKQATPGSTVWQIGSPGAVEQVFSVTEGRVRAIGNQEFLVGGGKGDDTFTVKAKMITTTNPVNPGDSGGPLFNKKGEIVGVTQSLDPKAVGVSFFVDVSEVKNFLDEKKIVIKAKDPADGKLTTKTDPVDPKEPKEGTTETKKPDPKPAAKDESKDEKAASALLSAAKTYAKDEELRAKYVAKLKEVVTKYPNTAAAKDAKRLLDGLK